jgi:hypothetical protein
VLPEVFSRLLTANTVVALEHHRRVPVPLQQLVVVRLVEQAKAVDRRRLALPLGADVDPLDRGVARKHRLQIGRRQLTNWRRRLGRRSVIAH